MASTMGKKSTTTIIDVGMPTANFQGWDTAEIRYPNFANHLPLTGQGIKSPIFTCLGCHWILKIKPGGARSSSSKVLDRHVAIYLINVSNTSIHINYSIIVKDSNGREVVGCRPFFISSHKFGPRGSISDHIGIKNFAKRSNILQSLVNGTLVLGVQMQLAGRTTNTTGCSGGGNNSQHWSNNVPSFITVPFDDKEKRILRALERCERIERQTKDKEDSVSVDKEAFMDVNSCTSRTQSMTLSDPLEGFEVGRVERISYIPSKYIM